MSRPSIAVIDDYQEVALASADWSAVTAQADLAVFTRPWRDEDEVACALAPFDIVVLLRERTAFRESLVARLPRLRLLAMTGNHMTTLDIAACTRRGIVVSYTQGGGTPAPAELAFALILACARSLPRAHRNVVEGRWQEDIPMGLPLAGRRLGIVGLGKLGGKVADYGKAFGMDVVAWSPSLTDERAAVHGVARVDKAALFATSDVVSVHATLNDRTRGLIGAAELDAMKPGAILVNTARGPLVDETALLAALRAGRIVAGLDVFDVEPLPAGHPLTTLPNVVLAPHLGFVVEQSMRRYYTESVENILAFLRGAPIRVANPDVLASA